MIKVLIPDMPTADEILPFLREIDSTRVYVNGGPLMRRLEQQLAELVGNPCRVVANGTVSLELALRALNLPRGGEVLVPAVTYVASGQAIVNAGLRPVLCDVDEKTWHLTPEIAAAALPHCPKMVAVMPVATYGAPVPLEPWERFAKETRLPIVVDAAGAIYGQEPSASLDIVVSFSLHATKALGCGEGGVVATANEKVLQRVEHLANFGPGGTNAKMSEYHAAVGLASRERGPRSWRSLVAQHYVQHTPDRLMGIFAMTGRRHPSTLLPVLLPRPNASAVVQDFDAAGIEAKQWYRPFLDERAEFYGVAKIGPMPVTDMLRKRCLGLPWHAFLTDADVARVCEVLGGLI
jgi:dTDP-4-amino-4,6-dideoxygalactose transaminase